MGSQKESDTAKQLNNNNNCISQLRSVPRLTVINTKSFNILMVALLKVHLKDFPCGSMAKTLDSQCRGPGIQSLVWEQGPACCD